MEKLGKEISEDIEELLANTAQKYDRKEALGKKKPVTKEVSKKITRCRYCLDAKMQLRALPKHVKTKHPDDYITGLNPNEYVAREGQSQPEDPKWKKTTLQI